MKNLTKLTLVIFLLLAFTNSSFSQTTYNWKSTATGSWATSSNWTPTRTTPASTDILVFNNVGTKTITTIPTQTIGDLQITGNSIITLTATTASSTLTISNGTGTDISVSGGSQLTISTNVNVTLASSATADITGTLSIASGRTYNTDGTSVVTTVTGTVENAGTITCATASKLLFQGSSTYEHSQNGGTIPTATWNSTSDCNITGMTSTYPSGTGQSFGNFTFNSTLTANLDMAANLSCKDFNIANSGAFTLNLSNSSTARTITSAGNVTMSSGLFTLVNNTGTGGLTISGNLNLSGGTLTMKNGAGAASITVTGNLSITGATVDQRASNTSSTATITVGGDFSISAGSYDMSGIGAIGTLNVAGDFSATGGTITESSTGSGAIVFNGTGTQTYTSGGTISNTINFTVNNGATLQMAASGTTVSGGGSFTLSNGATLGIKSASGITSSASSGNIQVTGTRTFNTGSNYTYNGSAAQVTGSGMPSTVNILTVDNAAGLSLTNNATVSTTLDLSNGTLTPGSKTLTIAAAGTITNAGSTNYVDGELSRVFSSIGSKAFPVGTDGNYRPVTFNYTVLVGTSTVTVEQVESPLTTGSPALPASTDLFTDRYWNISQSGASVFTYKVTLDATGYAATGTKVILKKDASITSLATTTPNYTTSSALLTSIGSPSAFGIGSSCSAPTINTQPTASQYFCPGSSASISVIASSATGAALSYQWKKAGVAISGATSSTYTIPATVTGDAATYTVSVTSCGSTVTSNNAVLVNGTPSAAISYTETPYCLNDGSAPVTQTGQAGGTYSSTAGLSISSSTGAVNLNASSAGTYTVTYTFSGNGCSNTTTASITINALPANKTVAATTSSFCGSGSTNITVSSSTSGVSYQLRNDATDAAIGSPVTGTGGTISFATGTLTSTTTFNVLATSAIGCTLQMTNTPVVTINPLPVVSISANYCYGGGEVQLTATAGASYLWNTGATTQAIVVDLAGTYSVTVTSAAGCSASNSYNVATELITNGTFNSGNTGFSTLYTYTNAADGLQPEGYYAVGTNAHTYHTNFWGKDHTTGSGNFMIVNGSPNTVTIWQQNITIIPNTYYYFSAFAMSVNDVPPYAQLRFAVNGTQVGTVATLTAGANSTAGPFNWVRFYGMWNSGSSTSATLSIVDLQTAAGGNDFGLDDISFSSLAPVPMSVAPLGNGGNPLCSGNALNMTANVTGGYYPLTYTWTGENSFTSTSQDPVIPNATSVNAGSYSLSVTDLYGCVASGSTTVTINTTPAMTSASTAAICSGTAVSIPLTSSTASSYSWIGTDNGSVTGESTTAQSAGTLSNTLTNTTIVAQNQVYTVTPTSTAGSCVGTPQTVTVTVNPKPAVSAQTATACSGTTFTVTPTGVPTGTTYTWSAPTGTGFTGGSAQAVGQSSISQTLTNTTTSAVTATYTVTPTSGSCAGNTFTVTVTINPTATVSSQTATICSGAAFTVTPTGVPTGTTYTWSAPTGTGFTGGSAQAVGQSSISQTLTNTTTSAVTATYTVTPLSGSCTGNTFTITVTINPKPAVSAQTVSSCSGTAFTVTPTGVLAGTTYTWTAPTGTGFTGGSAQAVGQSSISQTLTNAGTTAVTATYTVTPTSGSCTGSSFTVTVTVNPVPAVAAQTATVCSGTAFTVTPTGVPSGTTYTWTAPSGTGFTGGSAQAVGQSSISQTLTNTTASAVTASYTVTPTSGSCVGNTFIVTVTLNPKPAVSAQTATICSGAAFTVTPAGVPAGTTYTWTAPSGTGFTGGSAQAVGQSSISQTLTNTTTSAVTATYTVTPLSGSCTGSTFTVTVTVNPVPAVSAQTATACSGTAFTVTPTGVPAGTTYTWTAPTGTGFTGGSAQSTAQSSISQTLTNTGTTAVTATYTVTPVSGSCTGNNFTVTVTVNPVATISSQTAIICTGGTFTVTPSGVPAGTTYTWTAPSGTGFTGGSAQAVGQSSISQTLTNTGTTAVAATYTVTPTSGSCAGNTFTVTVTVNPKPVVSNLTATICTGTAFTVTPTGVPAGTTYTWSAPTGTGFSGGSAQSVGQSSISQTLTNAGTTAVTATYIVTPLSGSCTGSTFTVTVTVNPVPGISNQSAGICTGGTFTITPTGVPAGTTYTWTTPSGTGFSGGSAQASGQSSISQSLTNSGTAAATATYTVTPTASTCMGSTFTATVTVNPVPVVSAQTATICSGTAFTVTPTGVPAGTTYTWTAPSGTGFTGGSAQSTGLGSIGQSLTNTGTTAVTAIYTVTPTAGSCTGNTFTVTVTINPKPAVSAQTSTICSGAAFTVTPTGVPAGTTYTWSAPSGTGFTGGSAQSTGQSSISQTLTNTGTTAVTATYTVTPLSGSCTGNTFTITVTINPKPAVSAQTATVCSGAAFTVTPTGVPAGTTYTWTAPTGTGFTGGSAQSTGQSSISQTLTNSGTTAVTATYTVTPTSGTCAGNTFTVTVTINPTATVSAQTATICSGSAFTVTPTGVPAGTTFTWTVPSGTGFTGGSAQAVGQSSISQTLTNTTTSAVTATYTVTPISGSCTGSTFTVTVTINPVPAVTAQTTTVCSGTAFTVTPTGVPAGTTYTWTAPTGAGFTGGSAQSTGLGSIGQTLTNAGTTAVTATYTVTPLSGSCTGNTFTVTVTINPKPSGTNQSVSICSGIALVSGIPDGLIYSWPSPTGTGFTGATAATGATGTVSQTLTNTGTSPVIATYTITPATASCIGNPFTVALTVNPVPAVSAQTVTACSGTAFTVTPTGVPAGTTYTWTAPSGTGFTGGSAQSTGQSSISQTLTNTGTTAVTATYTVTPTSGSCAGNTFTVTVTLNPKPAVSTQTATICSGAAFTITPAGVPAGTTYTWTAPSGTGFTGGSAQSTGLSSISQTLTNTTTSAVTATYTVTPLSGSCAGNTFTVTITINPVPAVSAQIATVCSGTAFTVTPTGVPAGTTYTWTAPTGTGFTGGSAQSTGQSSISQTLTNTGIAAVTATYTVTPVSGSCTGNTFTVTVTVNPVATVSNQTAAICTGGTFTVTPSGVPAGTTYTWTAPSGTGFTGGSAQAVGQLSISQSLINTGTTAVAAIYTVTPTSGGCAGNTFTVTVTVNPRPVVSNQTTTICSGSAFTVTPSGVPTGTTYTWSAPTGTGFTGGSAQAVAQSSISQTLTNSGTTAVTATYTVTPTSGSCVGSTFTVTVTVNPMPGISNQTATICTGSAFTVTPTGVPAGTTYTWTAPSGTGFTGGSAQAAGQSSISQTLTNTGTSAVTATYTVTPTAVTCMGAAFTVTVTVNPVPSVTNQTTTTCSGTAFSVTPSGVPAGTSYTWTAPTGTGFTGGAAQLTGLGSIGQTLTNTGTTAVTATYTVTPTAGTCVGSTFTLTVTVNPKPAVSAQTATICSGAAFTVTPTGVPTGTTYTWTAPSGTGFTGGSAQAVGQSSISQTLTNTGTTAVTATYTVTPLTGSCTGNTFAITVTVNPVPAVSNQTATVCSGTAFTVTPTGVPAGTTYTWTAPSGTGFTGGSAQSTGQSSISQTLTNTGTTAVTATYTVTPTSGTCAGNTFTVTVTINPTATVSSQTATICSGAAFTVTPSGVPAGTTYTWTAPSGTGFTGGSAQAVGQSSISQALTNTTTSAVTATYTVTPTSGSCAGNTFTITVTINPKPAVSAQTVSSCTGTAFTVTPTGVPAGTTYTWTAPTGTGFTGGSAQAAGQSSISQTLTNAGTTTVTATYTVTPTSGSCTGSTFTVTVTVNPKPAVSAQTATVCSGTVFTVTPTGVPAGTTYTWTAPSGTGFTGGSAQSTGQSSISQTLTNTGTTAVTATYTVTPTSGSCAGNTFTVTVTLNPKPALSAQTATICSGTAFTVTPTGVPAGTTYTWTAPSGTGFTGGSAQSTGQSSISQTLTNTGTTAVTATYTVTPTSGTCAGSTFTVTVTVNPVPAVSNQTASVCTGSAFTVTPTGVPTGTTYTWTAPSGSGFTGGSAQSTGQSSISQTLTNTGATAVTATYTVTPTSGSCVGNTFTVTVTVYSAITANSVSGDQAICSGSTPSTLTGSTPAGGNGTYTYLWEKSTTSATSGFSTASGTSNAINYSPGSLTQATWYRRTVTSGGCTSTSTAVQVTINSAIASNTISSAQTICANTAAASLTGSTPTGGSSAYVYSWESSTVSASSGFATAAGTSDGKNYAPGTLTQSTWYRRIVTSGGCTSTSSAIKITATALPTVSFSGLSSTIDLGIGATVLIGSPLGGTFSGTGVTANLFMPPSAGSYTVTYTYTNILTGCSNSSSQEVTVGGMQSLSDATIETVCAGSQATVNLKGLLVGSLNNIINYSIDGVVQPAITGLTVDLLGNTSFQTPALTQAQNGKTLRIISIANGANLLSTTKELVLSVISSGTWLGLSSNWGDGLNWCGGIPRDTTNVLVPSGLPFYPIISTGLVPVKNLVIQSGASMVVRNATLQVKGAISNSGLLDLTAGTLELAGSAVQNIAGSMFVQKTINNLVISNTDTAGVIISSALGDTLKLKTELSFGNVTGKLTTGDNLVLLSDATGTARVASLEETATGVAKAIIKGLVIVERFYPSKRAWRLISAPIQKDGSTPTINQAWQEGASPSITGVSNPNPHPGYGTHITGPNPGVGTGIDQSPPNNSSLKYYKSSTNTFEPVLSTLAKVTDKPGYFLFVRGDRSYNIGSSSQYTPPTIATLRVKGNLNTGKITMPVDTGFQMVGNPYASAIKLDETIFGENSGIMRSTSYHVWDPLKASPNNASSYVGGWVPVLYLGNGIYISTYDPSQVISGLQSSHEFDLEGQIQSGAAFIIDNKKTASGNFVLHESSKISGSNNFLFRPVNAPIPMIKANAYFLDANNNPSYWGDGAVCIFDDKYSNDVLLSEDVRKAEGTGERFALRRDKQLLSIESRKPIGNAGDTLFYDFNKMYYGKYRYEFITKNMDSGLVGFIEDNYLKTRTPLNMSGSTTVDLTITSTAGTWAADRFRVVFARAAAPPPPPTVLPVKYSSVKATERKGDIAVEWVVETEINVKEYQVEKSTDGTKYTKVNTTAAHGNSSTTLVYNWLDKNAVTGDNYYRIRSVDLDGKADYSPVVKVRISNKKSGFSVSPNASQDGAIGLQLTNIDAGIYNVRLFNNAGQQILVKVIKHTGGSANERIATSSELPAGTYTMQVISPDNTATSMKMLIW